MKLHYNAPAATFLSIGSAQMVAASPTLPVDPSKTTPEQHSQRMADDDWEDE